MGRCPTFALAAVLVAAPPWARGAPAAEERQSDASQSPADRPASTPEPARTSVPGPSGGLGVRGVAPSDSRGASATAKGSIDREAVRRVIREHAPEIRACYQRRLEASPGLEGKVILRWSIENDGAVAAPVLDPRSTLADAELVECMKALVATWRFPQPRGGGQAIVVYPWILRQARP